MVEFTSKVAGRDILASGSVLAASGEDTLYFKIANLELRLIFEVSEDKKPDVVPEIESDTALLLRLKNFSSPFGTYYTATLGNFENRTLHVSLVVYTDAQEKPARNVTYTFSLGEVVNAK